MYFNKKLREKQPFILTHLLGSFFLIWKSKYPSGILSFFLSQYSFTIFFFSLVFSSLYVYKWALWFPLYFYSLNILPWDLLSFLFKFTFFKTFGNSASVQIFFYPILFPPFLIHQPNILRLWIWSQQITEVMPNFLSALQIV